MTNELLFDDRFWNRSRCLSALITVVGVAGVALTAGAEAAAFSLFYAILPIAGIWWPEVVGRTLLGTFAYGKLLTHDTPELGVLVIGWLLLLSWLVGAVLVMLGVL